MDGKAAKCKKIKALKDIMLLKRKVAVPWMQKQSWSFVLNGCCFSLISTVLVWAGAVSTAAPPLQTHCCPSTPWRCWASCRATKLRRRSRRSRRSRRCPGAASSGRRGASLRWVVGGGDEEEEEEFWLIKCNMNMQLNLEKRIPEVLSRLHEDEQQHTGEKTMGLKRVQVQTQRWRSRTSYHVFNI